MAPVPPDPGRVTAAPAAQVMPVGSADHAAGGGRRPLAATGAQLRAKERAENFPVAMRLLPRRYRAHLVAVYRVVRTIDDLGDEAVGDRGAQLDEFAADLTRIWRGEVPRAAVLRQLVPTVRACGLEPEPFQHLVEANRQDQRVTGYETYQDLLGYCRLSAQPVGRLVLSIFGAGSPDRVALSDRICDALQLVEHWQDVAEDRRAGRVYLPREDVRRFGVTEADLDAEAAADPVRRLIAFEAGRAGQLLDSGTPLVGQLRGWARLAVAGYVAGGRAAIDALRRADWDVMSHTPRPRRLDVARHVLALLLRGRGRA
jgi:squalene synthase HpnC